MTELSSSSVKFECQPTEGGCDVCSWCPHSFETIQWFTRWRLTFRREIDRPFGERTLSASRNRLVTAHPLYFPLFRLPFGLPLRFTTSSAAGASAVRPK